MNSHAANWVRNAPLSEVWWPASGSTMLAIVVPTLASIRLPAAPIAQNTTPKVKPIASPTNNSLTITIGHEPSPIAVYGAAAEASGNTTIARLTKKLLRTSGGIVLLLSSGRARNAATMRGRVSATPSTLLPKNSNGISVPRAGRAGVRTRDGPGVGASVPRHVREIGEQAVGEVVQRATDHRGRDEQHDDDHDELHRVAERLLLQLGRRLYECDQQADDRRRDDRRRRQHEHEPQRVLGQADDVEAHGALSGR